MTRISERQLLHDLAGTSLDLDAASADPRLADVDLPSADRDGDGAIATDAERAALFGALDALDRDGNAHTLTLDAATRTRLEAIVERGGGRNLSLRLTPPNDRVLHIGVTSGGPREAAALRTVARVVALESDDPVDRAVRIGGRVYPLGTQADRRAFAATLGLPAPQTDAVASALDRAEPSGRGELARLAAVWAPAERGGDAPSRLVLSGHASGVGVHGDGGTLSAAALGRLAAAMPRAARFVEDLHVAACYSGLAGKVRQWRDVFPNLRTFWGYDAFAPSGAAAARHLLLWERATRRRGEALAPDAARGTPRGDNLAVWTESRGHRSSHRPLPLDFLRHEWERAHPLVEAYARGEREVQDPHGGELREAYADLQNVLGHPELPPEQARVLEQERAFLVRLLFFRASVLPRFTAEHAAALQAGFTALGAAAPALAGLGRRAVLDVAAWVERAVAALPDPPPAALRLRDLLVHGLRELSPALVPEHWIGGRA